MILNSWPSDVIIIIIIIIIMTKAKLLLFFISLIKIQLQTHVGLHKTMSWNSKAG